LRELVLPLPALKAVLEEYLLAITQRFAQVERLDDLLEAQVPQWRMYPAVQALMGLRGVQLVAATVIVSEIGDIHRFAHPRHLMAFLGLIPREHTTGDSRKLGSITKTGNAHARWMLGEVSQHAFLPPKVSSHLALRQKDLPAPYRELSWKMQIRLYQRSRHLLNRGVMKPKITVALARELCGFVWALLRQVPTAT
jgi:transposase